MRVVFPEEDRAGVAAAVGGILASGMLTLGPYTRAFEAAFAAPYRARHAAATGSGTCAPPGCRSNICKYIVLVPGPDRARFTELARAAGVQLAGGVYELSLHQQPVLAEYAGPPLPVAEDVCARHVSLRSTRPERR